MIDNNDNPLSRKEFLRKSSKGLLALTLFGKIPLSLLPAREAYAKAYPPYRTVGRTQLKVTPVGFGASRTMEPAMVKSALDSGINFLDTGRIYYNGQNEVMLGKVVRGIRKEVVIQSRALVFLRGKDELLKSVEGSKKIRTMLDTSLSESLKALQTDYIDIYLIHGASKVAIIEHEAVMDFFRVAKEKGQIRACGFSSHDNQVALLKAANKNKFYDVIMIPYNHKGSYIHSLGGQYFEWDQQALEAELKQAENNKIGIIAMKTCSGGPYSADGKSTPSYKAALKWILNHSYVSSMAVAMGNIKEMNENVQAMG
jgi:aryl-alcohol dehydrogenase-like predicted oxidoreductase